MKYSPRFSFMMLIMAVILVPNILFGQPGNAIFFDNSTFNTHGDFIYCGTPSYGFSDKLTVSAWVKWSTDPKTWAVTNHSSREGQYATYIANATHNTVNTVTDPEHGQFWLRNGKTGNKIEFTVENTSGTQATASVAITMVSGTWYFLAGVYDGANVILYIDGVQRATAALTGNIRANTDCRLNMGRLPWGYGFFVGYMDEVRIWNTALTAAEVLSQKTSTATIQDASCKSYWNFNAGSGTAISDSKNLANGTFYSALIDVHGSSVDFPNKIIEDADRLFVTGAWNGKTLYTVSGAGVDQTNSISSNTGNVFTVNNAFGTTPVLDVPSDPITNMTWFGVLDNTQTAQWVVSDIILPVELTSFTANVFGNNVLLRWHTATEVNNYGFEIERRLVNSEQQTVNSWQKIGFVNGAGTSGAPKEYSYSDASMTSGSYVYRLKQIDQDGTFAYSEAVEVSFAKPAEYALNQNYPNPFNPTTMISYQLPVTSSVTLKVYNVIGEEVAILVNETKEAGSHTAQFNATNLSSGIYYFKLTTNKFSYVRKMLMIK